MSSVTGHLTYKQRPALGDLRKDQELVILPADKGNATVILNRPEYIKKVEELLQEDNYRPLKKNPIRNIERQIHLTLLSLKRKVR